MSNMLDTGSNIYDFGGFMSYREKSVWASLLITAYILFYYLSEFISASNAGLVNEALVTALFIKIIAITIVVEVISQTVIAIVNHKEADKSIDEREQKFKLLAYRNAYHVLTAGVFIALFLLWKDMIFISAFNAADLSPAYATLSLLLICFLLAELTFYCSQAFLYRRGY